MCFINYYKFIKDESNLICYPICELILEELIEIIKHNSLHEIEYTINNVWKYILEIIFYDLDHKETLLASVSNEIINRCSGIVTSIKEIESKINISKYLSTFDIVRFSGNIKSSKQLKINTQVKEHREKVANFLPSFKDSSYDKYNIFVTNMSKSIINYFKPDENETKVINFINNLINTAILNNNIENVKTIILVTNSLINIDIFINNYYDLLVKRLTNKMSLTSMSDFEIYIQNEREVVFTILSKIILKNKITEDVLYKINKVINDTELSFNENINFSKLSNKLLNTKLSVITTSFENWNINQTEGIIDSKMVDAIKETQIGKCLKYYDLYYTEKYKKQRIINWFPHFGEINITYLNQKFKMLPIQFMILEMFNNVEQLPLQQIINSKILSNYSEKFKTDIINSMIISGLFIMVNENIILSQSKNIKNDLIEIFLNTSDYPNIWEQMKQKELTYSRDEIVNTVINHTLKTLSKSKSDLFILIKDKIKLFKLEEEIYTKSLKYLVEMDYIKLNDNDEYEKII